MPFARSLGALIAMLASTPAFARDLHSSDIYPRDYPTVRAVAEMDRLLRERSAGRYRVSSLGHDSRYSENFTVAQVRNGTLDMARISLATLNGIAPATAIPGLPYLFRSSAHAGHVLNGPIGDEILASLEAHDLIGLAFYDAGPRHFYATRAIRVPSDLRGLRVRVQLSDSWATLLEAVGAQPVAVPADRLSIVLQSGVVEAAEHNLPTYMSSGHYRIARYFSPTGHAMTPAVLIFSKRIWETLPAADRELIRRTARDSVPAMHRLWEDRLQADRAAIEASNVRTVRDVDHTAFVDAFRSLYPTVVHGPHLSSLMLRIQTNE